ncbi:MAG: ferrous iron transport protein A [Chloroflexi bacterium]|nr:ferrous iron transport protein A [Chloroflexota bacterium]
MIPVAVMNLSMAASGEKVRMVSIQGGHELRKRLADLGLNIGEEVYVIQVACDGPMILGVKDSRLAIGRGMAHKIMVEPA